MYKFTFEIDKKQDFLNESVDKEIPEYAKMANIKYINCLGSINSDLRTENFPFNKYSIQPLIGGYKHPLPIGAIFFWVYENNENNLIMKHIIFTPFDNSTCDFIKKFKKYFQENTNLYFVDFVTFEEINTETINIMRPHKILKYFGCEINEVKIDNHILGFSEVEERDHKVIDAKYK